MEGRNAREGSLWWVANSGTGTAWSTGSAPLSGLFGHVRTFDHTSAVTYYAVMERGKPHHWKMGDQSPITLNVTFDWTGHSVSALSGSGASVPLIHLEHKALSPELASETGRYHQFYGVVIPSQQNTEAGDGDTITLQMQALGMLGPTASGYLT